MRMAGMVISTLIALCSLSCGRGHPVVEIALHPTNPQILYIATNDYIYKTRDGGKTWQNISQGMTHSRVIALAIDPLFPANVYAGTKGDGVFRSYNGGQTWVAKRTGMADVTISSVVHQLVFVPGSSDHLFAATSMGVFETENAGDTWIKRMEGMKEVLMVVTLDVDPRQITTMYAGTSGGMYKTIDRARHWIKVNHGLIPPEVLKSSRALGITRVKVDPHRLNAVYAASLMGLYKTTDGAQTWQRIGQDLPDQMFSDLVLDRSTPDVLYVSSRKGVHKSSDGGHTWQAANAGLGNLNIRALAMNPVDSQVLYAGTNGDGLYRSHDGGHTWEPVPLVLNRNHETRGSTILNRNGGVEDIAKTVGRNCLCPEGMQRLTGHGQTDGLRRVG
ncbi:MAG: hypothetical protein D6690_10245 [Nitrospirae bacterium]|nr:MAG: hypothetical protein D6690_10245 [Nitrospirota bacterium]